MGAEGAEEKAHGPCPPEADTQTTASCVTRRLWEWGEQVIKGSWEKGN